ncbi:MAG: HEAT repeat domain-containing protein, partial [Dehalococcoidia bacterium]|nr:HEAT repeat domain-containing protein [Dehalococcoidia bacterium]
MEKISLREYFQQLGDLEAPVSYTNLVNLSNLAEEEITLFKKMWVIVPVSRRQQILSRLLEVSEDNLDVNFDRVFYCCISDSDPEIRATAVEGLGESESTDYISVLIKSIEHDPSLKVRIAATMALSKYTLLAEMGSIQASKKRDIERVLIKLVNDTKEDEELRRRALEAVSVMSIPEAKLLIEKAYR